MFDFFVGSGKAPAAVLALVTAFLAVVVHVLVEAFVGEEALFAVGAGEFLAVVVHALVHF